RSPNQESPAPRPAPPASETGSGRAKTSGVSRRGNFKTAREPSSTGNRAPLAKAGADGTGQAGSQERRVGAGPSGRALRARAGDGAAAFAFPPAAGNGLVAAGGRALGLVLRGPPSPPAGTPPRVLAGGAPRVRPAL